MLRQSLVVIMVERNLGFEAEHHHRALQGLPGTRHRVDHTAQRYGILTTEEIKHAMCTLLDNMLRERRVSILPELFSEVSVIDLYASFAENTSEISFLQNLFHLARGFALQRLNFGLAYRSYIFHHLNSQALL